MHLTLAFVRGFQLDAKPADPEHTLKLADQLREAGVSM